MKMNSKLILLASATLLLAAVTPLATMADENHGRTAVGERGAKVSKVLTFCDGGAQEAVITNTQDAPANTASAAFVVIPSTTLPGGASGAAGDLDTYTVTFSGEASATVGGLWEAVAQVSINGGAFVSMNPVGPNTYLTGTAAQTHTMTWCNRLGATASTSFRIEWRKLGGGLAIIDDYTVRVERSN
jgi:hypothetical protein